MCSHLRYCLTVYGFNDVNGNNTRYMYLDLYHIWCLSRNEDTVTYMFNFAAMFDSYLLLLILCSTYTFTKS